MSRQDRPGARTPADIERKYNFGEKFYEQSQINETMQFDINIVKDSLGLHKQTVDEEIKALQNANKALAESTEATAEAITELDKSLNQAEIFKRLSNDGEAQGFSIGDDGNFYTEAANIVGEMTTDKLAAGSVTKDKLAPDIDLGTTMTKLWQNPSPESEFAPQTVTLDWSGYDIVFVTSITSAATAGSGNYQPVVFMPARVGESGAISSFGIDSSNSQVWGHARYVYIESNGIRFGPGNQYQVGGNVYTNWNGRAVPTAIYGIKGIG